MAIYNVFGNQLNDAFTKSGESLNTAYDVDGNIAYEKSPIVQTLKAMTFNSQAFSGINGQETMLTDVFDTYAPDIIGFQECVSGNNTMPTAAANALSGYQNRFFSSHYNYNACFSKFALQNAISQDYETQDPTEWANWRETRSYIKC